MKSGFRGIFRFMLCALLVSVAPASEAPPPLILVSMDGFRWDYCDLHPEETPNLRELKRTGVSAAALIPVFPSNTFPSHYSVVTGLYPAHHGIVNNNMFDPRTGEFFRYNTPKSAREPQWWSGEPIWITAVQQGRPSAALYWPGSEALIKGQQATYWKSFDYFKHTFVQRQDTVIGWLTQPMEARPVVVCFYIEELNSVGHDHGPDSPELVAALKQADAEIGELRARFAAIGVTPNLVIVSDHGMAAMAPDRQLALEDYIDLTSVVIEHSGSVVALRPLTTDVAALEKALTKMPHARIVRGDAFPERLKFKDHPRIAPLWILPEKGWRADTRVALGAPRKSGKPLGGDHGYDPELPDMHGILIANGPAFRSDGATVPAVESIHVYNLMCAALNLTPAANDGDDRLVRSMLKRP